MQAETEIFSRYLKENGLRFTGGRARILKAVLSYSAHFDADELYLKLRQGHERISRASVYRTIPLLLACGLIRTVGHENGRHHYEHTYGQAHHCHLRCLGCGKVVEFTFNRWKEIEDQMRKDHGFTVTGHRLELQGYCPQCSRIAENQRSSSAYQFTF
jgi:Fur family ferric uptake transcriptional regulator